jgi:hypothetical protein
MDNNSKSGPESKVTIELVHRVSARVAKGIPVRTALADEPVSYSAYRQQLRRHPELAAIQAAAKIKFLDTTFDMIFSKPNALVRWILERRHPDIVRPISEDPDDDSDTDTPSKPAQTKQTIVGVPEDVLDAARKEAQNA